jgi:glycosyltransferase involved in cell wall biosynthesis
MRRELGIPDDAVVLLCAAAIKRNHKRIDHLLNEFARARADRPELPLCRVLAGGTDSDTGDLLRLGKDLIGDRFRPLVNFPRTRMPELYRATDIFTLCSLREMMPLAMLEATASGLPCIIHKHPSVQWIAGEGGVAVDMAREGELAGAIHRLASDASLRQRLGDSARRNCLGSFSRDRVIEQILDYYRFVLAAGAGAKGDLADLFSLTTFSHTN